MNIKFIKNRIFEEFAAKDFEVHGNGYSFVKKTSKIRCEVGFSVEEDSSW